MNRSTRHFVVDGIVPEKFLVDGRVERFPVEAVDDLGFDRDGFEGGQVHVFEG